MTDNPPDLKKIIRALNDQVTSAWSHLYAWRQIGRFFLQRPELEQGSEGFVGPCLRAHLRATILHAAILLEKPGKHSGVNLEYLLNNVKARRDQCPARDARTVIKLVEDDCKRLKDLRSQLNSLKGWRDQLIAHLDKKMVSSEDPPSHSVQIGVLRDTFKTSYEIIQRYNGLYYDTTRVAVAVGHDDFKVIGHLLEIGYDRYRELVRRASERAKDNPHMDLFREIDDLAWERQGRLTPIEETDEERRAWEWRGHPEEK